MMPQLLAAAGAHGESALLMVLVQLAVIMLAARVFASLFRKIGQPAVVGEIAAGLVLGPSVLGALQPDVFRWIFGNPEVVPVFTIMKELGLIFLLFLIGLEFDFTHLKQHGRSAGAISLAGIVLPFGLGWLLAQWLLPVVASAAAPNEPPINPNGFALFMGTAMSITALPILGRMMMELNITRSRLAAITITAAAVDDAAGWILLATVSAMVSAAFDPGLSLRMIALTAGFALLMIFAVRPLMRTAIAFALKRGGGQLSLTALAALFVVIFICSIATSLIGIFAIFGAFILGAVLSTEEEFRAAVSARLGGFVTVFFLPIFFTYTGLRTDIGTLGGGALWLAAGAVSLTAIAAKFGGCALAARASGFSWRESNCIGVMMNTRALMELIVINKGYELGVIPKSVFCMLVIMALLTTVMTTPILLRLMRGTELEPYIARSTFRPADAAGAAAEQAPRSAQ